MARTLNPERVIQQRKSYIKRQLSQMKMDDLELIINFCQDIINKQELGDLK